MGWLVPQPSRAQIRIVYRPGSAYRWDTAAELTTPDRRAGRAWQVPAGTAVTPPPAPKAAPATASGIGAGHPPPADPAPRSPRAHTPRPAPPARRRGDSRPPPPGPAGAPARVSAA